MAQQQETQGRSAFFYGTLMAPPILHRVIHGSSSQDNPIYTTHNIHTTPAILHNYRRHRVRYADYPAILPHAASTVRGTYVSGLTDADVGRLDVFEGGEYVRRVVRCRVLGGQAGEGSGNGDGMVEGEEVEAETYVWIAGEEQLEEGEWDFEEFKREKMRFWSGEQGENEYAGVDEAAATREGGHDGTGGRGVNGHITTALEVQRSEADEVVLNAV
ncbi:hypothetical protein LTR62_000545 [Meristemomyces frigidus]|uniref:Putative gamma-glutamylcyclotransferase n=1 Tax=Meristemomyces frigidus TaxID=1508187 RepID=A0AAN7T9D0_9PEZI|nr:hypothetical protein LTR62_000545 [Meristemomyces frigidus]